MRAPISYVVLAAASIAACQLHVRGRDGVMKLSAEGACADLHLRGDELLMLERRGCYGSCPEYKVSVSPQGLVKYQGDRHVRVHGRAHWFIPIERAHTLFAMAACARPETWRSYAGSGASDLPSAILAVDVGGRRVVIGDYDPCSPDDSTRPPEVCALEETIDALAETRDLVVCPESAHGCVEP
ncbi:MAG: DUF6438 domain-containing protein [Polyangiales bacterium]